MSQGYTFKEHLHLILVGTVAGLLSGLFFVLYSELKSQIGVAWKLFGVVMTVMGIYFIFILIVTYPVSKYLSKK